MSDDGNTSEPHVPETWEKFVEHHPAFPDMMWRWLSLAQNLLKQTPLEEGDDLGFLICSLMAASLVDFNDILVLAHANSRSGSPKILRSLYERTVTLKYLAEHSTEVENFIGYQCIDWQQVLVACEEKTGQTLHDRVSKRFADAATEARKKYRGETCPTCKQRKQTNWTPKSVKELSECAGLYHLHAHSYIFPSKLMHPTYWGTIEFLQRESPLYNVLNCAHELLVHNILIHRRHFAPEAQPTPMMIAAVEDFTRIWVFAETAFGGLLIGVVRSQTN
jgi:hypothetical protein